MVITRFPPERDNFENATSIFLPGNIPAGEYNRQLTPA